jgi:putative transposase
MRESTTEAISFPVPSGQDLLTGILRDGATRLLAQAIEAEVADYIERHADLRGPKGHRLVVRNGHLPEREIQTGIGPVKVRQPRVNDKRIDDDGQRMQFNSAILPKYLRKTRSIEELIPWLYLKGISSGDFNEALVSLLGPEAPGLSASTVVRLKEVWQGEYEAWSKRSLAGKRYVYFWADGVYFNVRLGGDGDGQNRQCILVIIGATTEGKKELVAIQDGYRESEQSWRELLLDLKARGLAEAPKVAVGDGALGFWAALRKVFGETREQRCWVHKTANVLNYLPQGKQGKAKQALHDIWMAASKAEANKAFNLFVEMYQAKYPKAAECLAKDREVLLTFYDFPAEHWVHLRTTNPIESSFATVRLRTHKTKGCGSRIATLTMVFKLAQSAEKFWRLLNGTRLLEDVFQGIQFVDGTRKDAA